MNDGAGDTLGAADEVRGEMYEACFAQGVRFRLADRPGTFRLSQAGLSLGDHLIRSLSESEIRGRILEVGTGSGALALVLRGLGAKSVTATDICRSAVATARRNEIENFGDSIIDFCHRDLFPGEADLYDLIVFNPPGWRAPSDLLLAELNKRHCDLDRGAMFYGDRVVSRFLQRLPDRLAENGRAIVGLNSLLGIPDVIGRSQAASRESEHGILHTKLLERIELPLMFYTEEWLNVRESLLDEFERGRQQYAATFVARGESISWFYDITEVTVSRAAPSPSVGLDDVGGPVVGERLR